MSSEEGGAASGGAGSVPSSLGASPGRWTVLSIGEEPMPVRGDVGLRPPNCTPHWKAPRGKSCDQVGV